MLTIDYYQLLKKSNITYTSQYLLCKILSIYAKKFKPSIFFCETTAISNRIHQIHYRYNLIGSKLSNNNPKSVCHFVSKNLAAIVEGEIQ